MKKLLFLLAMCSALTFVSCSKDEDETPSKFITATIDGNAFEAATVGSFLDNSLGAELLFSTGSNADGTFTIGLNIPTDTPVNAAQTIDEFDFAIVFADDDDNAFYTTGVIELTKNDTEANEMEGTFSFTAVDDEDATNVHEITNGAFKFTY